MNYFKHESSYVDEGAVVGEGTKIWHFSHIMSKARIGSNCSIGQNVFIADNVIIGNNVKIQNNVSIYDGVIIEDDVFLGPSMVFTNVVNPRSYISRKDEFRKTLVKKGASIGANATIICGNTLGRYAFVAAGATVTKDVDDFSLVGGTPAQEMSKICICGLRLKLPIKESNIRCSVCNESYIISQNKLIRQTDNE